MMRLLSIFGFIALLSSARAGTKVEAVVGQAQFSVRYDKATDFSGLTWVRGENFYAVSNQTQALFPLKLAMNAETGRIEDAKFGTRIPVKTKLEDLEGIAYRADLERLYVSAERPPGIVAFDLLGDATFQFEIPKVFARATRNKGLEALTYGAGFFWTANEAALEGDQDSFVRLQKFDERMRPAGQFAYRTDGSLFKVNNSGTGVTDLAGLPNGELLVLERVVAVGLVAKIYLVDFADATDTAGVAKLNDEDVTPVKKKLLFERLTGKDNFEGIALGPELADGWRSLILVADSAGGGVHELLPLRIKFDASEGDRR